jgi:outer membrane receptor for ferrienterochelin and colicins
MVRRIAAALLALAAAAPLSAQRPATGTVVVTVRETMGMLAGFQVRSDSVNAATDATGRARLVLPAGRRTLSITRIGFQPKSVSVTVIADSVVAVTFDAEMQGMQMKEVAITATRVEKLAGETPVRVEVIDEMEVEENTLMAPSGITMLLNETPGLRVFNASPTLGTGSVRILGLSGQYTVMLADGLPLYGGASSALGPLDISPVDLSRVEIIKGSASALYGGQSLGGVINLVAKPPTGASEFLFNKRTMGVTDAATWQSWRLSERSGLSILASGTAQDAEDPDEDGWGDQPRANRWGVRPRYNFVDADGRSLFVTAGYGYDDRQGGTLGSALTPGGTPFREGLTGERMDLGFTLRIPRSNGGNLSSRFALSTNGRDRRFGTGPLERDRISTGFAELTRQVTITRGAAVFGATVQTDVYANELNPAFDHTWTTPGLFVTADRDIGKVTVSASARSDFHPEAGTQITERLSFLAKPASDWSVRVSGGNGFAAPTSLNEEVEAIGLRAIRAGALSPERSLGAMLDVSGKVAGAEFLLTAYTSSIDGAIQLVDVGDAAKSGVLRNAKGATEVSGAEAAAIWRFDANKLLLTYGYADGHRTDANTGAREEMPMLNRHRFGADLMLEKPGVYVAGIEGIYYGRQALDDNPYRSASKPYVYLMAIYKRQFGPWELVANFENLLNIRQTDYDRLVRPSATTGGRWTTDVWAPLEGFMANVAFRYRWNRTN